MKKLLCAITVFLLVAASGYCEKLPSSALTPKAKGEARAQQDIKNRKMRILHYGKPWSVEKPLVDDESKLPVEIVEGCDATPEFVAETNAYNNLMRKTAEAKQIEAQPLTLTIKSDKQVYEVGEKIKCECTVKNLNDEKVKYFYVFQKSHFVVNNEKHSFPPFRMVTSEGQIGRGEEYALSAYLNLFIYNRAGTFSVVWKYDNFTSNTITIEVVEEKGISKGEALEIARKVCKEEGWEWKDKVVVLEKDDNYFIMTNKPYKGGNVEILIDRKNGSVISKQYHSK